MMGTFTIALARYFVASLVGALFVYWLYWCSLAWFSARSRVSVWRAPFCIPLQAGRSGYCRLYCGWVIAFAAYGLIATYEGTPFTWDWWDAALLDGGWIVVLVAPLVVAYPFWRRADSRHRASHSARHGTERTACEPSRFGVGKNRWTNRERERPRVAGRCSLRAAE